MRLNALQAAIAFSFLASLISACEPRVAALTEILPPDSASPARPIPADTDTVDTIPPTITSFSIPATSTSPRVSGIVLDARDDVGVTGFYLSELPATPAASATGWSELSPTNYSFTEILVSVPTFRTLYAWAEDAAGNISPPKSAAVIINLKPGSTGIIFEDNFDQSPDWTSHQLAGTDLTWPATGAISDGGACSSFCPPPGWTYYGGAKTLWTDDNNPRKDTYALDSTGARGGTGKGIIIWHEGGGTWADGNMLSKYLGSGYPELYVRFYLKYEPGWTWTDGSANHGQQKIMRIASYGNGNETISTADPMDQYGSIGWNAPVWMPYFYHNSSLRTTRFLSGTRLGPRYVADSRYEDLNNLRTDWPSDGQWHSYELHVKLNSSPGSTDGKWGFYIDGILKESRSDIPWVQSVPWLPDHAYSTGLTNALTPTATMRGYRPIQAGTSGPVEPNWIAMCPNIGDTCSDGSIVWENFTNFNWNHLTFLDNMYTTQDRNRHVEEAMYFDDVVISTTYVGPDYVIP